MMRKTSRQVRKLHFEALEPRLAPDAVLTGAALLGTALSDDLGAGGVAESEIELAEISALPNTRGGDEAVALPEADMMAAPTTGARAEIDRRLPDAEVRDAALLAEATRSASETADDLSGARAIDLLASSRPQELLPLILASSSFEEPSLDGVTIFPELYSGADGGAGSLVAHVFLPQEAPTTQATLTFSLDGATPGITINNPVHVVTVPILATASTGITVAPGTASGAFEARATLDNGETASVPFYVVDVSDFDVHYQKPDGGWAGPDTFLADDPSVPVFWPHDTLRWRPTSGTGYTPLDPSPSPPTPPPIAIAGDWDGDGIATSGLLEPEQSDFLLRNLSHSGPSNVEFGFGPNGSGWDPIAGDWDGDGDATVGFFDPVGGTFYLQNENVGGAAEIIFRFGPLNSGWEPIAGDWDGDGDTNVGLYDEVSGTFYLLHEHLPGPADVTVRFGPSGSLGWLPIGGDWDGDGDANVGLYDEAAGKFFLLHEHLPGPADVVVRFGPSGSLGWLPLAGDWDGDGDANFGLYDVASGTFHLRTEFAPGPANISLDFGHAKPLNESPVTMQMMRRPWGDPTAGWEEFGVGGCDSSGCEAFGHPGVGDWEITPVVWYGGGPAGGSLSVGAKIQAPTPRTGPSG